MQDNNNKVFFINLFLRNKFTKKQQVLSRPLFQRGI